MRDGNVVWFVRFYLLLDNLKPAYEGWKPDREVDDGAIGLEFKACL